MLSSFRVYMKYVDRVVDMDVIEPGECSVISLINDAKKVLSGQYIEIKANNKEDSEEENVCRDAENDGSDKGSVDNEYEVGEESKDDSDVSLVNGNGDKDNGNENNCQLDGDETTVAVSSNEETTLTRIVIFSDHVSNNISECFNNWIRDDRDKPILQLLENFKRKIMVRFCEKWAEANKLNDIITPYARENLTMNEGEARKLEHAHNHVHWYYSKQAWKMAYDGNINPIPDESKWPEFESQTIEPPVQKAKARSPKKKITRATDEPCAPNATFLTGCLLFGVLGHNQTTCPSKDDVYYRTIWVQ
ncbi:hypothetical protein Ddye_023830 [Dipteronia dyeriana]|uniref:Uncharacterized protein n=1 Tax=Dipteronia dyeriana TaxID=168575 RepID=A0AAD9TTQ1_9ROSI|nr:hypothetical protein Ddye_023830 [Dipteronia dyeriana]